MKGKRHSLLLVAALTFALLVLGASSVFADSGSRTLLYLVAVDPLCGLDLTACPAVTMADNGDTIELTGAGTLSIHTKSVTGDGTFTHNFAGGGSVSGTWTATELLSYHSYGTTVLGSALLEAGKAVIRVHLVADGGSPEADAILEVTCVLPGVKVPGGAQEGVRLNIQGLINFNKEVSGLTVFIP